MVRATSAQVLGMLTFGAARPVDWTPVVPALRALLDATNLFAHIQLMETLTATRVSPVLAPRLLGGGGAIVLAKVGALDPSARSAAHKLLTQLAGRDLGDDPAAWQRWVATLPTFVDWHTRISVDGLLVAAQSSSTIAVTVGQDINVTFVTFTREPWHSVVRVVEDTFEVRPRRGGSAPR